MPKEEDEWYNGNSYQALRELFGLVRIGEGWCFESKVCLYVFSLFLSIFVFRQPFFSGD